MDSRVDLENRLPPAASTGDDASIAVLVNNAGIAMSGDLASADADRLESMIQLNVLAPSWLALATIPGFVARGGGTLINISSVLALAPEWFNGSYSGTKAYLLNLSLRLQQEVAGKGVRGRAVTRAVRFIDSKRYAICPAAASNSSCLCSQRAYSSSSFLAASR